MSNSLQKITTQENISKKGSKNRTETGALQINDDWPGIFIRGDNAFAFARSLDNLIELLKENNLINLHSFIMGDIECLRDLLSECLCSNSISQYEELSADKIQNAILAHCETARKQNKHENSQTS